MVLESLRGYSDFVRPLMPCLDAVYAILPGRGRSADTLPLLTMRPPRGDCSFIMTKASRATWKAASRLMPTTWRHASYVISSTGVCENNGPLEPDHPRVSFCMRCTVVRAGRVRGGVGARVRVVPLKEGHARVARWRRHC